MVPIGKYRSKWVKFGPNGSNWSKLAQVCKMVQNGSELTKMRQNRSKLSSRMLGTYLEALFIVIAIGNLFWIEYDSSIRFAAIFLFYQILVAPTFQLPWEAMGGLERSFRLVCHLTAPYHTTPTLRGHGGSGEVLDLSATKWQYKILHLP